MLQKTFVTNLGKTVKVQRIGADAHDKRVNRFRKKNTIHFSQFQAFPAFEQFYVVQQVFYEEGLSNKHIASSREEIFSEDSLLPSQKKTSKKSSKERKYDLIEPDSSTLPSRKDGGAEIGALWYRDEDNSYRGNLKGKKIKFDAEYIENNSERKEDRDGNSFYIIELKEVRCLLFPVKNKIGNMPDLRIIAG